MSGGTYMANVDLTANTSSVWESDGGFDFPLLLPNTAALDVVSLNVPATLPATKAFHILQTPAKNDILGDFATQTVAIGATGKSYKAAPDTNKQNYDATTP